MRAAVVRYLLIACAFSAVYFLAGRLGLAMAFENVSVSPVWPPTGIALAGLFVLGRHYWPSVLLGAFLVNALTRVNASTPMPIFTACGIAVGNTLQAIVGAALLKRWEFRPTLERLNDALSLIVGAALCSTAVSATIGVFSICLSNAALWDDFSWLWWQWWIGDALSDLVVAPLLFTMRSRPELSIARRFPELTAWLSCLVLVSLSVFLRPFHMGFFDNSYWLFPILIWAALRFSPREVAIGVAIMSAAAIAFTLSGRGPFLAAAVGVGLVRLQAFMGVLAGAGLVMASITQDRRRTEDVLRETDERLARTEAFSLVMVTHISLDGRWMKVPPTLCELLGRPESELLGRNFQEVTHPDDFLADWSECQRMIRGMIKSVDVETRYIRKDGSVIWVYLNSSIVTDRAGKPLHFVTYIRDITGRKLVEQALRRAHDELEARVRERTAELERANVALAAQVAERRQVEEDRNRFFTISLDMLCIAGFNGYFKLVNPAFEQALGWTNDELLAKPYIEFVHPDDRRATTAEAQRLAAAETQCVHFENRFRCRDGGYRWLLWSAASYSQKKLIYAAARDITERKQAEEELQRLKNAAEAASRAKSDFLACMSHEIRTPMNGVIGMTGLLLDTDLTPKQRQFAETIRGSGEALLTIINDILDFSKIESGKLTFETMDFDLLAAVESTIELLADRAQAKGLETAAVVDPDVPLGLRSDPGRLRQVLTNLVGNAVKFTDQGEVALRVSKKAESADHVVLHFAVTDTGVGIPEHVQPLLFQPFIQAENSTTRRFGGTGLGLAISKRLVEMMDGRIGFRSAPHQGSEFWFTARFAKQAPRPAGAALPPLPVGVMVLLVEPKACHQEMVRQYLHSWGVRVHLANSGAEALDLLRRPPLAGAPRSLVLTDATLPDMDGVALAEAIQADPDLAGTRVLLLTPLGQRLSESELRARGIANCLSKPIRKSHLYDGLVAVLHDQAAPTPRSTGQPQSLAPLKHGSILIVEDNAVNQQVALLLLEKMGYAADTAGNGLEAITALESVPYALVLMDCQMPEMDGYEATARIRQREGGARRTAVVAMTANAMQGDREKCLAAGMDDYLPKPVREDDLARVLKRWLPEAAPPAEAAPAHPAPAAADVLDRRQLTMLLSLETEEDTNWFRQIFDVFVRDTRQRISVLRAAADNREHQTAQATAHALKGSAGSIGAHRLANLAASLEQAAHAGALESASDWLPRLESEFEQARRALEDVLGRAP